MAQFIGLPGALPITAYYKGSFGMVFNFTSGGTAYPLTGASAAFVIYEKNGTAALTLSGGSGLTINEAGGSITLGITNTQMVALATQEYNYEFILTLSGGNVWPVLDSVFNVSENGQASYSGDTVTVALDGNSISLTILPAAGDVGSGGGVNDGDTLTTGLTFPNTGLHILDTNATHDLIIASGSNLTADRTLTVTTGDADRTLTISGDTTLSGGTHSGTNTGDQTITLSGDVSGSGTGAITATISALDAAKIADGTVSNTEFQYLIGVTSGIQGQIDGKAATSHTHAIGDVTGLQTALDGKVDENAAITGATKTKVTYDTKGLVTAGADATTADIADSSNKRYVTDAQLTVIGNTSGTNTGDQTSVTGNAGTVTVADAAADTTTWVLLGRSQTGNLAPATDAGLTYNASTNALTATTFVGALNGNADTVTGFSGTHSGTSSGINTGDQDLSVLQPKDATLTALAALTIAADTLTIGTGADAFSQTSFAANTFPAKASTGNLVAKSITDFGLSLVDDADAATARTTLGVDAAGTDNSTAVTLAGTLDYITITGQTITRGAIDLTTDVTGALPAANGGTGLTALGTALQVLRVNAGATALEYATPTGGGDVSDGDTLTTGLTFPNTGLHILDTNASHDLILSPGSDLSADRTLTITTGDANRTLTISADATISGTNTGDQTISLTGDVTGSGTGSFAATIANSAVTLAKMADMSTASLLGRNTAGTGAPEVLSAATAKTLLSLNNVENTALSTWAGTTNITTLGTIATGTWSATEIAVTKGGTGLTALGTALQQLRVNAGATALEYFTPSAGGGAVSTDTIWDAKGDLAVGTGADTAAKLTVGANGKQIYADSGEATGLRWGPDVISPSQITADQDDYTPTGWADAQIIRLDGDSGFRAITSMASGYSGEVKTLVNIGSYPIYFPGEHPDGTAGNRISTDKDFILFPKRSLQVYYDGTSSRWRIIGDAANVMDGKSVYHSWSPGSTTAGDWGYVSFQAISSGSITGAAATGTTPPALVISSLATSTGGGSLYFAKSVTSVGVYSSAHSTNTFLLSIPTLSDGTDGFTVDAQFTSSPATGTISINNGIGVRYADDVNSGKWELYSKNNAGSETTADTGVTVTASELYLIRIEIDKSKTEARAYINGAYVGRVTATLPNDVAYACRIIMLKSNGSNARTINVHSMNASAIYP